MHLINYEFLKWKLWGKKFRPVMAIKWKAMTTTTTTNTKAENKPKMCWVVFSGDLPTTRYTESLLCQTLYVQHPSQDSHSHTIFSIQLSTKINERREKIFHFPWTFMFFIWKCAAAAAGWLRGIWRISATDKHVFSFNYFVRHGFTRHINKIHVFSSLNYIRTELHNLRTFYFHPCSACGRCAGTAHCVWVCASMSSVYGYF